MTQAPTPTPDIVRRLVRSLLGDGTDGPPAAEVRPVSRAGAEGAGGSGGSGGSGGEEGESGEGADGGAAGVHSTWWVGTRHVLRLAPDRDASARLRRELRLRDLVRAHMPVTVPVSVAHGDWAPGLAYTLDSKVPGSTAQEQDVTAVGEADLAGLLGGLREVPLRQAEALGVPRAAPRSLEALRRMALHAAGRLGSADEFEPGLLRQLTSPGAAQLAAQHGTAVLVHHGLRGDHLLVSADGRVRGVLGWADVAVGDPAEDIACLALAVGSGAAVRAATLAGYGARPCLRGLWLARCDGVLQLGARLDGRDGPPLPVLRAQLRHAWEAILLERVTELRGKDEPLDEES
ncbi:aminoglycoside phosphotransferase family protein [Streptomyces mangrovisoli]|uniref:Transferase n=1 Tax=Streptomyces mangrovisoli TaxID=1428628 RepID=A0A1J4NLJ8_9ACTN|nr:aminoglycoside phosphotransferase family protein [Streptomyces mangrovisoli]OIJ63050.1 transferase [Streptomyces mangrovisoli]